MAAPRAPFPGPAPHVAPAAAGPVVVTLLMALLASLPACGGRSGNRPEETADVPDPAVPNVIRHDFGVLPHGTVGVADLVVPCDPAEHLVPSAYGGDCTCAKGELIIRDADGNERVTTGRVEPRFAVREGETLILRLSVDTGRKEARDQPIAESRGQFHLQPLAASDAVQRPVAVRFTFGIDSPVRLLPTAVVNFGELALSHDLRLTTRIRPDDPDMTFSAPTCPEPRITCGMRRDGADTLVDVTFESDRKTLGAFQSVITVPTSDPDYTLEIPVTGTVVPDLTAVPGQVLSMGNLDFVDGGAERFLTVADRSPHRVPDFRVESFVDQDGEDPAPGFTAEIRPLPGDPRRAHLVVTCGGGYPKQEFRGVARVASGTGENRATIDITVLAFHRP